MHTAESAKLDLQVLILPLGIKRDVEVIIKNPSTWDLVEGCRSNNPPNWDLVDECRSIILPLGIL